MPTIPHQLVRVNKHFINHQQLQKYEKKQLDCWEGYVFPTMENLIDYEATIGIYLRVYDTVICG